uniref:Uncharacterized protein n=1 Tax=Sinocyclocheilus rhinocerous TaxID=307959 RepID=A0A673FRW7_9TELE
MSVSLCFIIKGHSLSCYECISLTGSCADQQEKPCPSGTSNINEKMKGCAADCASGSMNLGIVRTSSVCCNTDRCNVQDAPGIILLFTLIVVATYYQSNIQLGHIVPILIISCFR